MTKQNLYYQTMEQVLTTNQTKPLASVVQQGTSSLISHLTALETGLAALVMLVSGPLSDQYGRKPFLVWNLFFLAATQLAFIMLHVFDHHDSIAVYYGTSSLFGLAGGSYNLCLMVFSYVGDLSSLQPETRLRRFTAAEASATTSLIAGSAGLGLLASSSLGEDLAIFTSCTLLLSLSLVYVLIRVQNILPEEGKTRKEDSGRLCGLLRRLKDLCTVAFRARRGRHTRAIILIFTACFLLHEMPYQGGFANISWGGIHIGQFFEHFRNGVGWGRGFLPTIEEG